MAVVGDMSKAKAVWRVSKADPPTPAARTAAPRASDNLVGAPTDAELAKSIKTAGNRPVIVDFGASWCDHCKGVLPAFVKMSEEFTKPLFVLTDVDNVPEGSKDVRYTPTFTFFKKGRRVDEIYGVNQQQLRDHVWLHSTED